MTYHIVFVVLIITIIVGFFYLPVAHAQLNECTTFDGKVLVVIRSTNDCLGYADARMASEGWTIILINNESIYMEKHNGYSQLPK